MKIKYIAVIKQYYCPAFPEGLQYLDYTSKSKMFDYLGTLRLIDTPYIAVDATKGEVVDKFMEDEVIELIKKNERSEDEE